MARVVAWLMTVWTSAAVNCARAAAGASNAMAAMKVRTRDLTGLDFILK
jgi:hypothetical protein